MRTIRHIVLHCSATPAGRRVTAEEIDRWHRARGFRKIGYHYIVYLDGSIVAGRPTEEPGAHVSGHNADTIGICYVGGTDASGRPADTRTERQKASLVFLLQQLHALFPQAGICGHRDFSPDRNGDGIVEPDEWIKACPSFDARSEYEALQGSGHTPTSF